MSGNYSKSQLVPVQDRELSWSEASEWSLVLAAQNIPHWIEKQGNGFVVLVPEPFLKQAEKEIELFIKENEREHKELAKTFKPKHVKQTILTLAGAAMFMSIFFRPELRGQAMLVGAADAYKIVHGEWWRVFTALTLHADPGHFLSNLVIGGFIVAWLIEETSLGTGWFLTIMSGAVGNYINALYYGQYHVAIGASTAVFGALGALVAIRAIEMEQTGMKAVGRPIGAGLALLAFLGSGEGKIDVLAHFFGFIAGMIIGAVLIKTIRLKRLRSKIISSILGLTALFSIIIAWGVAVKPILTR